MKYVQFTTADQKVPVVFNVQQGNPDANDSDGGNITAFVFNSKGKNIAKQVFAKIK